MKSFVLLLTLAMLAVPSSVSGQMEREINSPALFAGTWKTIAGGTHRYTVVLKQTDDEVNGTYSPGNGKIFDGVVKDSKLTFKWTQDGGFEGTGEFTMNEDGKGFTGSSTALKPQEFTNTWNTYEPEPASFAGTWETISDGQNSYQLTVVQNGNKVTGLFPSNNGKLEGTVVGRVLRFKWESESGTGSGRFVMDENNQAFSGTYNRGADPNDVEATWNGSRGGNSGGKAAVVSFAGEWTGVVNGNSRSMSLAQTGSQVTGSYQLNADKYYQVEGAVSGNTLSFKLTYKKNVSTGEFVMDTAGKSFKGIADGVAVSFSFVGPVQPK